MMTIYRWENGGLRETQELDASAVPEAVRETYYAKEAPHTMYIGEIIGIG